jgi:hypothetical protein
MSIHNGSRQKVRKDVGELDDRLMVRPANKHANEHFGRASRSTPAEEFARRFARLMKNRGSHLIEVVM